MKLIPTVREQLAAQFLEIGEACFEHGTSRLATIEVHCKVQKFADALLLTMTEINQFGFEFDGSPFGARTRDDAVSILAKHIIDAVAA